jgi:endonuclease/exonuclease/phosphatase family metal-dependent hydrolase
MKYFFRGAGISLCFLLSVTYILASLSPYISPAHFSFISLLALAFPYIFFAQLIVGLIHLFINKKAAVILLLLLVVGYKNINSSFAWHVSSWQNEKDSSTLRIMTWNVHQFDNMAKQSDPRAAKRIEMLNIINHYKPDVLCVQEYMNIFNSPWAANVPHELDSLGYHYHSFSRDSIYNYRWGTIEEGVALFSKIPIADSGRIKINEEPDTENLTYGDILFKDKRIRIFTAHLASFRLYNDTVHQANKDIYQITYDRKRLVQHQLRYTEILHDKEIAIIRKLVQQSPYPVVYCGDINSTPATYSYYKLKDGLQDAFLKGGFGFGGTFYKILPTLRIDMCFVDPKFTVTQCKIPKVYPSDHFPVVTDIQWRQ